MTKLPITVLDEVYDERQRQIGKGYTKEHDDRHSVMDFCGFIRRFTNKAHNSAVDTNSVFAREKLIEVAALAVAAVESIDRKPDKGKSNE